MRTIRLLPTVIPVLWMVGLRCAASGATEAESPEAGVVLEGGEIDSRTVAAGARVMVVHGRGERHPVSGEWTRLDTSAGYVHAIHAETLVLAREGDLRQERISLNGIQRLVMEGPPAWEAAIDSTGAAAKAEVSAGGRAPAPGSTSVEVERREERGARVYLKVGSGALGGVVGGFAGVAIGIGLGSTEDCESNDTFCGLEAALAAAFLGATGYTLGAAVGVSRVDPHDRFIPALGGSAAGLIAGACLTAAKGTLWPTLFACPIALATAMSELTRNPPEDRRLSFGLSPTPGRGISAAAALRF